MKRMAMALVLVGCAAMAALAQGHARDDAVRDEAVGDGVMRAAEFGWVDIVLEADGGAALGAWQVELVDRAGVSTLVGVEGGEHAAYREPAFYDPAALVDGERIVLASFSTADALPVGKTRVARVHARMVGDAEWSVRVIAAGDRDGKSVRVNAEILEGSAG